MPVVPPLVAAGDRHSDYDGAEYMRGLSKLDEPLFLFPNFVMMVVMNEQVEAILGKASLENEDQELWREYLKWAPPFLTERFVELFKEDVHDLPEATIKLRQNMSGDDLSLLQVVLDKELEALNKFFNN